MPNLKDLKNRIGSVKSTQKITKAMQMVAAAKLRRAEERAKAAAPYADRMQGMISGLAANVKVPSTAPKLLVGTGKYETHLLIVVTSDRGLCGGFNSSIVKAVRQKVADLQAQRKEVKLLLIGSKGYDQLKTNYSGLIVETIQGLSKKNLSTEDAYDIARLVINGIDSGEFDRCSVIYNRFESVISQIVTTQQLVPLDVSSSSQPSSEAVYEYEPNEEQLLEALLPRNLTVQILHAMLESAASEQGARMSAMDNATRNAGEMIKGLTLQYNRTRQSVITNELIEIISGAEAL